MALGISKLGAPAPEYSVIGHNIRIKFKALFKVDGGLNGVKEMGIVSRVGGRKEGLWEVKH